MNETKPADHNRLLRLSASLLIAVGSQTFWALNNRIEQLDARFIAMTAIVYFGLTIGIGIIKKTAQNVPENFDSRFALTLLAFAGLAPYFVITNLSARIVLIVGHMFLCGYVLGHQFQIERLKSFYAQIVALIATLKRMLLRPALYVEIGDIQNKCLDVKFYGRSFKSSSQDNLKDLVLQTIYDLPTNEAYDYIDLDLENLENIDDKFKHVLSVLDQFKSILNVKGIRITPSKQLSGQISDHQLEFLQAYIVG